MSKGEIRYKIKKLKPGKKYKAKEEHYLIKEKHSVADIIRFAIKCSDVNEVQYILDTERRLLCN